VVLTSYLDENKLRSAINAGASGYLLKSADADDVADAIRKAQRGEVALAPDAARLLVETVRNPPREPTDQITSREKEVLALVAEGYTNQQIANRLGVAERTARTHVSNILTKLGLTSRRRLRLE
jgi:DNA-binding NarL/FixJ family response regulator